MPVLRVGSGLRQYSVLEKLSREFQKSVSRQKARKPLSSVVNLPPKHSMYLIYCIWKAWAGSSYAEINQ